MSFFKILLKGHTPNVYRKENTYTKHWIKIQTVWNNDLHVDTGIERLIRLFLLWSQYIFPGLHIRKLARSFGSVNRDLIIELWVIIKLAIPFVILFCGLTHYTFFAFMGFYMVIDTLSYIATLFFLDDLYPPAKSYRRSIVLLLINYLEITTWFGCFYSWDGCISIGVGKPQITSAFDHLYFSFITSATIGYGDFVPDDQLSKLFVVMQSVIFLIMTIMFFSFFISRIENLKK